MADKKVNVKIGYSIDKAGLEEMQSYFQRIANQAAEPGKELNSGLQKAGQTAKILDEILERTFNSNLGTLNVTKFNQELQKSGITLKTVKADFEAVGNQGVIAYNRLAQAIMSTNIQLKQSNETLDKMFVTFKNTIRYGISSSIFNNFTNSIQKAYSYTRDLDESLNNIRIVTGKSADEMDRFAIKANEVAKNLSANTLDYSNAALIYYQQGLSDLEAQARAETTVKVANVTSQTGKEVSEQLTAVWNGYKVSAEETEVYVDKLAAVAATTAADLQELSIGMSKVASAANAMGVDFDDLNAQIATIVSVTRQAPESVGTALKTIYARLGDLKVDGVDEFGVKLGEITSQMQTMGIEILDINGEMRDMTSVMAEVAEKWNTWTSAQRQAAAVAMAGKRQYNNLIALFDNWDMYTDALNTSVDALGTLQKQQDIYAESTNAKLKKLKATWQDLYKSIGDTKAINSTINIITDLVQTLDNFSDSFGGGIKSVTAFGTVLASVFNKQITSGIVGAIQRTQVLKSNLESLKALSAVKEAGIAEAQATGSQYEISQAQAIATATKEQLEYTERIHSLKSVLTQEQQNELLNQTQAISNAVQEKIVLEDRARILAKRAGLEEEYNNAISMTTGQLNDQYLTELKISKLQEDNYKIFGETTVKINEIMQSTDDWKTKLTAVGNLVKERTGDERTLLEYFIEEARFTNNEAEFMKSIQERLNEIIKSQRKNLKLSEEELQNLEEKEDAWERIVQLIIQSREAEEKATQGRNQAEDTLALGEAAAMASLNITSLISSIGSLAMAWGSLNSLAQTWSDIDTSLGDKMTQTFMTLGMTLPIMISNFKNLTDGIKTYNTIQKTHLTINKAMQAADFGTLKIQGDKVSIVKLGNITQEESLNITKQQLLASGKLIEKDGQLIIAEGQRAYATNFANKIDEKRILITNKINTALATSIGMYTALAAVAAASIAAIVVWYNKYQEARLKEAQVIIDVNKEKQKEIDLNKELYDSYQKAYEQYQNGITSKEELGKVAEKLAEKYKLEGIELAKLTGQYENLNNSIKEARSQELEEGIKNSIESEWALGEKLNQTARKGLGHVNRSNDANWGTAGILGSNILGGMLSGGLVPIISSISSLFNKNNENYVTTGHEGIDAYEVDFGGELGKFRAENIDDPRQMLALYDEIAEKVKDISPTSGAYKDATEWLEKMKDAAEETRAVFDSQKMMMAEMQFNSYDIDNIQSLEEYEEKVARLRKTLKVVYHDEAEVEAVLADHFKDTNNEFIKTGRQLETVKKLLNFTDDEWQKLKSSLTSNEIDTLLSGSVDLTNLVNYSPEQVAEIIHTVNREIEQQDLDIVVSLRAKITSDKKLTKKELEEALGEKNELLNDEKYGTLFNDFDNMSSLEQLELLNNIIADRINLNKEWEKSQITTYTKLIEAEKEYQRSIQDRANQIKAELNRASSQDQIRALQLELAKVNEEIDISNKKLEEYADNMSQLYFNEVRFNNLIAGIDGVISEAQALKDLTSAIGEGWVIAADKIENFAKNFPELLADQENYNFLQDGSLHLTEEGQKAFEKIKEARKEEIILQNEAYKKELQITAEKKLAEYEYYKNMADILERQVHGEEEATRQEADLKKNLEEFKVRMMNITGKNDEELNAIIQKNSNLTTDNVVKNVEEQYKAYQQLASAIVACTEGREVPAWQTNRASAPPVETAGHELTFETDFLPPQLSEKDRQKLAAYARQSAEVAYDEYSTAISKIASADAQTNALLAQLDNTGKGKNKNNKDKDLNDEFDRYYDIKNAITLVGNALERVEKIQSKLHGKELIQSLKNENNLIKQQADNYKLLYSQQEAEAAELQSSLAEYGINFDGNGYITNYASITQSMLEQYQAAIAGGLTDEAKQTYEKAYEEFKKDLERYNTLFYSEMKDTRDKIDDALRQEMENNLKMWETEIEIKLNTEEAKRNWADFLKEMSYDFRKVYQDLSVDMDHFMLKMETYTGLGTIETDLQAIRDVIIEIDKMNSGHASSMFESISEAQEKLKELDSQLESDAKDMKSLWQEAWDTYLDGIDQTKDKLGDIEDRFDKVNEELEFQSKLIELLYGDEAYSMLNSLYKGQETASENQIASVKTQVDLWHQLWVESGATLENQSDWTEDQKKYYEEWTDAQSKLNELVTDYIDLLKNDYLNTVSDVLKKLESALTGSSLDDIATQWGRITKDTEKYYDSIEQVYEAQKFANKIDKEISKTSNVKNQQKLMELRDREVTYLREKKNLTKYDLDAAEARYQIALKEIALEEAQQNKTSMKLVRNEQGNWSYQYMADADDIQDKQDDLLQSYGDLYKLAGDAYQDNLSALQSLQSEYLDSAREIYENMYLSEEEKEIKLEQLRTYYYDQYNKLAEENQLYRNDLTVSGSALLLQVYKQDEEAYSYMTSSEQSMLDTLINSSIESYQDLQDKAVVNYNNIGAASTELMEEVRSDWTATAQLLADSWNADDGVSVKSQIIEAHTVIGQATEEYQQKVNDCAETVERDFGKDGIKGAIDTASLSTLALEEATKIMADESTVFINNLKSVVNSLGDAWSGVNGKVTAAIKQIQKYLSIAGEVKEVTAQLYNITGGAVDLKAIIDALGGNGPGSVDIDNDENEQWVVHDGVGSTYFAATEADADKIMKELDDKFGRPGQATKMRMSSFKGYDTGGYTGSWNNDNGKLAFLHQKELVLNQDDTSNFLKGISILRDMAALNGSIEKSIAASIGAMVMQMNGIKNVGNINTTSSNNGVVAGDTYYVTAEFPNAESVEEIKQAILNLPNVVAQYTNKVSY